MVTSAVLIPSAINLIAVCTLATSSTFKSRIIRDRELIEIHDTYNFKLYDLTCNYNITDKMRKEYKSLLRKNELS